MKSPFYYPFIYLKNKETEWEEKEAEEKEEEEVEVIYFVQLENMFDFILVIERLKKRNEMKQRRSRCRGDP